MVRSVMYLIDLIQRMVLKFGKQILIYDKRVYFCLNVKVYLLLSTYLDFYN